MLYTTAALREWKELLQGQEKSTMRKPIVWSVFASGMLGMMLVTACDGDSADASEGGEGGPEQTPDGQLKLSDTARQAVVDRLGTLPSRPPADPTNRYADDPDAASLGQKLYFDAGYSENGAISCATCHIPDAGFQDNRVNTSLGLEHTGRSAPSVINAAYGSMTEGETVWHFWDGRKDSQWSQVLGPPESPVEMGSSRTRVAYHIERTYRDEYEAIFGAMPTLFDDQRQPLAPQDAMPGAESWDALSPELQADINTIYANFGKAIAAYERLIVSRNSRFDRFYEELAAGAEDSDALTAQEKLGLELFVGKAGCVACHGGPNFSDWSFHNIAVGQEGEHLPEVDEGRAGGIDAVVEDLFNCAGPFSDHPNKDACAVVELEAREGDLGAFKTPSLRSVSQTGPYMHTGMISTLDDVMDYYAQGGHPDGFVGEPDPLFVPFEMTERERAALVAFMKALDGEALDPSLLEAPR